jgi:hypothetical protein
VPYSQEAIKQAPDRSEVRVPPHDDRRPRGGLWPDAITCQPNVERLNRCFLASGGQFPRPEAREKRY